MGYGISGIIDYILKLLLGSKNAMKISENDFVQFSYISSMVI